MTRTEILRRYGIVDRPNLQVRPTLEADILRKIAINGPGDPLTAPDVSRGALDRECRPRRALGVVLVRDRIAKQSHQPVAQLPGDVAAHPRHRRRGGVEISADQIAPFLVIELRGNAGRTH